ncbi:hypothetical protein ACQ4PT_061737 [Festuca glaucescens]
MSRRQQARTEAPWSVRMRGYASPPPVPVFPPPPPEYAGSDSAASHVWWGRAAATDPNLAFPTDCLEFVSFIRWNGLFAIQDNFALAPPLAYSSSPPRPPYARAIPYAAAKGPGPSFIAGATDDIGRAIAFHRVASGLGLVLFDRNPDKLAAGEGLAVGLEALKGSIRGHDGGMLVNNADVSYLPVRLILHGTTTKWTRSSCGINVASRVGHPSLPRMVDRKAQRSTSAQV